MERTRTNAVVTTHELTSSGSSPIIISGVRNGDGMETEGPLSVTTGTDDPKDRTMTFNLTEIFGSSCMEACSLFHVNTVIGIPPYTAEVLRYGLKDGNEFVVTLQIARIANTFRSFAYRKI